jgi:hypothetical protein
LSRREVEDFTEVARCHLPDGWRIELADGWTHVFPPGVRLRAQGWKVHVSVVPDSAGPLLDRVIPVLVAYGCPFKFAASPERLTRLIGRHADRGSSGKFLTVYPLDDAGVPDLARALDEATDGLAGPRILSDRPVRTGSLVHVRFGGFVRRLRLAGNGVYEPVVTAPDGSWIADRRTAWFEPPPWAPKSPLTEAPSGDRPQSVLLDGRFLLRGAIRHANKGGVFRALDRRSGEEVVVKQGRRHVEVRSDGGDVRDLLRNEARMLARLARTGLVPAVRAMIELPEHTFLVVEAIEGVPLSVHIQRLHRGRAGGPDPAAVHRTAARLLDLVTAVHREGVVIRDLTPANVLVLPDESLRLIDLELAGLPGEDVVPGGSPGYAAPEQWTARRTSAAADLYGFGAILFALATGAEPVLADDDERGTHERIAGWLSRAARDNPTAAEHAPRILALMQEDPARRTTRVPELGDQAASARRTAPEPVAREDPARRVVLGTPGGAESGERAVSARAAVRAPGAPEPGDRGKPARGAVRGPGAPGSEGDRLLDDGLAYLIASGGPGMDPDGAPDRGPGTERWWPADAFGATTDPCNLYYGAAGVLGVLAAARHARPGGELRTATARAARWLDRYAAEEPLVLPGLHFGRSGTYWALLEAGVALGDDDLVARTADAAERLPVAGPVPDVSHGIAGSGLTVLRFWHHTGRASFLRRAGDCADALLEAAVRGPDDISWPVPPWPPYLPDGAVHYGFAHGTAGIAAFLLDAADATGREDCQEAAHLAGRTLCAAALDGEGGTLRWGAGPGDPVPLSGWCSGAAGVGGFLLRLWGATGEKDFLDAARGAAKAVRHDIWQSRPVHCHGTAGSIDYLMDVAEATGEEEYAVRAREAVSALVARAVVRDGRLLTPDHGGLDVNPGWGVGTAGVVAALLRPTGTPSLFMPAPERAATCRTDRKPPERKAQ